MEKRSFFQNFINAIGIKIKQSSLFRIYNGFSPTFSSYTQKISDNDVILACINTIATHCAKFEPLHYQNDTNIKGEINYLLSNQPNEIMTAYDFIYRPIALLYLHNNAFVYIDKDENGMITGFYPINYTTSEFVKDTSGNLYLQFYLLNGQQYTLPYDNLIHLRRFYNDNDLLGSSNSVLNSAIQNQMTAEEGIGIAIKTSNAFKGIYQVNQNLKEDDIKKSQKSFVDAFINENNSGIATVDSKGEFKPINLKPITLDKDQLQHVNQRILNYFTMNTSILSGKFDSEDWNSFYESVLEPLSIYLSQAFKIKIFSKNAIQDGHTIRFLVNRVKYASPDQKIKIVKEISPIGIITVDQALTILDLPPIGGKEGSKRMQSLNYINSEIADAYQLGKIQENEKGDNKDE